MAPMRFAVAAGLLAAFAYVAGSIPWPLLLRRLRLRQDLRAIDRTGVPDVRRDPEEAVALLVRSAGALVVTTIAWKVMRAVAPGGDGHLAAPVGYLADQVLLAWESMALWAGAAYLIGVVAPVFSGFRGEDARVPAAAVLLAYAPNTFVVVVVVSLVLWWRRPLDDPTHVAAAAGLAYAYAGWVGDWPAGWGSPHGPELTLWLTALAGIALARRLPA